MASGNSPETLYAITDLLNEGQPPRYENDLTESQIKAIGENQFEVAKVIPYWEVEETPRES